MIVVSRSHRFLGSAEAAEKTEVLNFQFSSTETAYQIVVYRYLYIYIYAISDESVIEVHIFKPYSWFYEHLAF